VIDPAPTTVQALIQSTTGPGGLAIVLVYSFLIAVALPFPGEIVLAMPLNLGVHPHVELGLLVGTSSLGKSLGALAALRLGHGASRSGLLVRAVGRFPAAVALRDRVLAATVGRYGYLGLTAGLAVPLMPDTALIYAFSALERDYLKFAVATFVGTVARLLAVAGIAAGVLSLT